MVILIMTLNKQSVLLLFFIQSSLKILQVIHLIKKKLNKQMESSANEKRYDTIIRVNDNSDNDCKLTVNPNVLSSCKNMLP